MATKVSVRNKSKCTGCSKIVAEKDSAVQYEICEGWFHCKCQNVPDDTYKFLMDNDALHWYCSTCNKGVANILELLSKMQARQDTMEGDLEKLKTDLNCFKLELEGVREIAKQVDSKLDTAIEAKLVEGLDERVDSKVAVKVKIMKDDVEESLEIEKRKSNLIFHGVKESESVQQDSDEKHPDSIMIDEILKVGLKMDASRHIEEVSRIGRYVAGKVRPLRVKIRSIESRGEILKRAKNLKDNDSFKRVFISPDLTFKQRAVDKDLRDHVKKFRDEGHENVKIKAGKVIKNVTGNQDVILYQPQL
jgi:hypothetical protein